MPINYGAGATFSPAPKLARVEEKTPPVCGFSVCACLPFLPPARLTLCCENELPDVPTACPILFGCARIVLLPVIRVGWFISLLLSPLHFLCSLFI